MFGNSKLNTKVKFYQLPQKDLNDKVFTICDIGVYEFTNVKHNILTIICNDQEKFYISDIANESDTDQIAISRIIKEDDIKSIFNIKELSLVFSDKIGFNIFSYNINPAFNEWIQTKYSKDFDRMRGKYYSINNPRNYSEFYYYTIGALNSSIDIEVFDQGDAVFYSTIYVSNTSIVMQ